MFAVLAFVAFTIAAIMCFLGAGVTMITIVGIIACGLALLALHSIWAWAPWR